MVLDLIQQNDCDGVRELLAREPESRLERAQDGSSLIRQALYRQRPEMAKTLLEAGAVPDFYDACALGDWDTAERFLTADKSLAASFSEDGFPALGLAIFFGHQDLAIHLLALGAPVNEPSRNTFRVTPLHSATAKAGFVLCAVLLSHGADPNAKEFTGGTPLHTAAGLGDLGIVKLLVRHGASVTAQTDAGETPLDFAQKYQRDEVEAWLSEPTLR
jgi:ankyrin repeat protein